MAFTTTALAACNGTATEPATARLDGRPNGRAATDATRADARAGIDNRQRDSRRRSERALRPRRSAAALLRHASALGGALLRPSLLGEALDRIYPVSLDGQVVASITLHKVDGEWQPCHRAGRRVGQARRRPRRAAPHRAQRRRRLRGRARHRAERALPGASRAGGAEADRAGKRGVARAASGRRRLRRPRRPRAVARSFTPSPAAARPTSTARSPARTRAAASPPARRRCRTPRRYVACQNSSSAGCSFTARRMTSGCTR